MYRLDDIAWRHVGVYTPYQDTATRGGVRLLYTLVTPSLVPCPRGGAPASVLGTSAVTDDAHGDQTYRRHA